MREVGQVFLTEKVQIINVEGWRKEKIPLEHHRNNCCGQDSRMNAKINEQNFKEKQGICVVSKYLPQET